MDTLNSITINYFFLEQDFMLFLFTLADKANFLKSILINRYIFCFAFVWFLDLYWKEFTCHQNNLSNNSKYQMEGLVLNQMLPDHQIFKIFQ